MHVTTAEFIKNYGRLADIALGEPVTITKNGHDRLVVIGAEEYARLIRREPLAARQIQDDAATIVERRKNAVVSSPPPMSAEEKLRVWKEWVQSHKDTPLLSDEAMSRASYYSDRW